MGNLARAIKRREQRENENLHKLKTISNAEIIKIANEHFEQKKEGLTLEILNRVAEAWGYLLAIALEQEFKMFQDKKHGVNRISKVLSRFMNDTKLLGEGYLSIEDIIKYCNEKGIYVKDTDKKELEK